MASTYLMDYQVEGARQVKDLLDQYHIAYLAWEPRVRKTRTALEAANLINAESVLFVTTKKAISSILKDADSVPHQYHLDVINYERIELEETLIGGKWKLTGCVLVNGVPSRNYDLVIIDEAHKIGQFPKPAERTKALQMLCQDLNIVYLSGTPSPESYSQLYHQFWISPHSPFKQWENFYQWAKEFVTVRDKIMNGITFKDYSRADEKRVKDLTKHLFLTKTQKEAGIEKLTEEEFLHCTMTEDTYNVIRLLLRDKVVKGRTGTILGDTPVKMMNKIHQLCSGTVILDEGEADAVIIDVSKARFIKKNFEGKKIAIYYKFVAEKMMLQSVFGAAALTEDSDLFNSRDDLTYISQIQSGREGVNVSTADAIVMMNIDYSAVSYWQVRARLQLHERVKRSVVYWIFATGGIEEKIYKRVMEKRSYTVGYFKRDYKIK